MKLYFRTNLDVYRTIDWSPIAQQLLLNYGIIPRIGEYINVPKSYRSMCTDKKIPPRLCVKRIEYNEDHIEVELWYSDIDYKLYNHDGRLLERS